MTNRKEEITNVTYLSDDSVTSIDSGRCSDDDIYNEELKQRGNFLKRSSVTLKGWLNSTKIARSRVNQMEENKGKKIPKKDEIESDQLEMFEDSYAILHHICRGNTKITKENELVPENKKEKLQSSFLSDHIITIHVPYKKG